MAIYIYTKDVEKALQIPINALSPIGKNLLFRKIGTRMEYMVRERTARGEGPNGPFPPYKPKTIQKRLAAGKQVAFMDLDFTGAMLGGITQSIRKTGVVLYFKGDAAREHAYWQQKKVGFFTLNESELDEIIELIKDSLYV